MSLIILDCGAVQVLADATSKKHDRAMAYIEADRGTSRHRNSGTRIVVPASVRVEAGWDRTNPRAAINRFRINEHYLDKATTNLAARLRATHGVAVADAHIGAIIHSSPSRDITVLTSDEGDIRNVSEEVPVRIIRL